MGRDKLILPFVRTFSFLEVTKQPSTEYKLTGLSFLKIEDVDIAGSKGIKSSAVQSLSLPVQFP